MARKVLSRAATIARHLKMVTEAHTDLNIFAAVIALMESSLVSASSYRAEERIVSICRREQTKCLRRHDAAVESIQGLVRKNDERA